MDGWRCWSGVSLFHCVFLPVRRCCRRPLSVCPLFLSLSSCSSHRPARWSSSPTSLSSSSSSHRVPGAGPLMMRMMKMMVVVMLRGGRLPSSRRTLSTRHSSRQRAHAVGASKNIGTDRRPNGRSDRFYSLEFVCSTKSVWKTLCCLIFLFFISLSGISTVGKRKKLTMSKHFPFLCRCKQAR